MFQVIKKIIQYPRVTQDYPAKPFDTSLTSGKPVIHSEKCTACGECVTRCPSGAIVENVDTNTLEINDNACIFCVLCSEVCPHGAIEITGEFELAQMTYEELGTQLKKKIEKRFGRSLQIREVDSGSCNGCDYEINALNNPFNDIERFGIHFVASPRHADMLLVTGTATRNMELALLKTYEAAPNPKLVAAVGACACSGGIFQDSYAAKNGIDTVLPVDVYIPGCPPRPQAILYGILKAIDRL
ncbi:NADH-quinone oxidoreductase subunit NuoB [Anoxybacterium hadale]|uniref:NADH-quinone oxidoreductase subunit NuoB n=1 Tax=Anoxybacterium hadale TaxID=3408580 RepID=A0ACD1A7I6_9FIRM|nr:NADH-quinone oxidoreductase subunit NuoB [Clostridiales bacterium]